MNILLDECLPRKLGQLLEPHIVTTVTQCGWSALKNGELLTKAQEQFDIFLTVDRKLPLQQNISKFSIGIVIILSFIPNLKCLETNFKAFDSV